MGSGAGGGGEGAGEHRHDLQRRGGPGPPPPRCETPPPLRHAHFRRAAPDKALGARGWDNYSWHTDLPPGHPMVTGQQTVDFDLSAAEHAGLITAWGVNWITT